MKKNMGRVTINHSYVVDLDNPDMVQEAKDCLFEDISNAIKYNELHTYIKAIKDSKAKEADIPEFLEN